MKAREIIKEIEEHCNEELKCSKRLRFLLSERFQRIINEQEALKGNLRSLLDGESNATYDSTTHSTRRRPNTN